MDAKNVFRFWKQAWVVSQRPSLFSPFFISTAFFFGRLFLRANHGGLLFAQITGFGWR
ncbi:MULTISPECIES: hypothetical protein [Brevibacillus]|uniref:hypothetical protein n=1 Tax=Brevibacillus TaxID=55080 RepID=UPI0014770A4C|nr:hypothetical protein [Brevibacillus borstelensis]MBE5397507.1 hypothetical protein [Brevibacillus borstelensis]MCM3625184.1 hypothetical protein [Brevibacillus borstelensis]MED1883930.1 hypothetical protein [Brevibacillus borstelensis]MED2007818.1 hypothetical protein [Brevibacillus borstelensis]